MKCANCGTEFEDGTLFCPVCGKEVQWVPEYNTLETIIRHRELQEREKKKKEEQAQKEKLRIEQERKQKKKKKRITLCIVLGIVCLAVFGSLVFFQMNYNTFDARLAQAESAFSNNDYEKAMKYVQKALSLNSASVEANVLQAKIYIEQGDEDLALTILKTEIDNAPDSITAYGELLRLYEKQGAYDEIKALMDECQSDAVKDKFEEYISIPPTVTLDSDTYHTAQTIHLNDMGMEMQVYYTLDGSTPTRDSTLYDPNQGIVLDEEGSYTLLFIAYNEKGIPSGVVEEEYKIEFKAPDAPKITPASGQYDHASTIKVDVPEGCTAYYAFDETATKAGKKYTGPVSMPVGEHIFSAILVDKNGKASRPASATYVIYE